MTNPDTGLPPDSRYPAESPDPYVVADKDQRTWGMLCHLAAFAGYVIPFGWIIGPLVIWLIKKDEYAFVNDQGKEALNFQISMVIYMFAAGILTLLVIGIVLLIGLVIFDIVMIIVATVRANSGQYYRYPLCIRFIK